MATTFTRRANTYNAETGVLSVVESTIEGAAIRVKGDPHIYKELGLSLTENPTLLFTPETYGEVPEPGDEVTWPANGTVYKVKAVDPIAPDGVVVLARVMIGR